MSEATKSGEVASFHIVTFGYRQLLSRLLAVPAERWELSQAPGCRLGKVMGSSKEGTTRTSVEIRRWAILAVWENEAARRSFFETSAVLQRWRKSATSLRHYDLQPLISKGTWSGLNPFPSVPQRRSAFANYEMAVLTRAAVRPTRWLRFSRSAGAVDDALRRQNGCNFAMGVGEWPIGEQATFSTWTSPDAIDAFAYDDAAHSDVVKRTFRENWYREMLFSRFAVTNTYDEIKKRELVQS